MKVKEQLLKGQYELDRESRELMEEIREHSDEAYMEELDLQMS